ncbi:MAG: hypothetical protein SangKO_026250 [Sandaracinaceae bacterium]
MASIVLERVPQIAHMVLGLLLVAMPTGCYQVHGAEGGACAAGSPCDCRAALPVPEGVGWVGANGSAYAAAPPYRHTIPRPFWLGTYDATAGCYRRCVESGWCSTPETGWVIGEAATDMSDTLDSGYFSEDLYAGYPMIALTKGEAERYCAWLGGRLPTNGEWERAARGTLGQVNHWSPVPDDPRDPPGADPDLPTCLKFHSSSRSADPACPRYPAVIVPVGETEPSFFGHHDLYSTPLNWVSDWFAPYPAEEPPDDYAGPAEATGIVIARGTPAAQARYPYPVEADLSLEVWPFVHPVGVRCAFDEQPPPMAP